MHGTGGLVFAGAVLATVVAGPARGQEDAASIEVMTFNLRYGTADEDDDRDEWPNRAERVRAVVADQAPDVMGVQEALRFQLDSLLSWFPGYGEVGVGRDDGAKAGEYSAILYRKERFELLEHGTFWLSDTPSEPGSMSWGNTIPRIVTWARLRDRRGGRTFWAFNTHWDHIAQNARERSALLMRERIASRAHPDEPVVVTGDFNAGESNPAFRALLSGAGKLDDDDPAAAAAPADAAAAALRLHETYAGPVGGDGQGTFNGFTPGAGDEKIDAVLVGEGWDVLGAGIVRTTYSGRYPSDHFPVTARIVAR